MEAKLDRIRKQAESKLENQKLYGQTLLAIEETIRENNADLSPTAYFGAIMSTLESSQGSLEINGALLYLLDEVFPFLPPTVLRSKFSSIHPILEAAYEQYKTEQPVVRSIIGCWQELLANQDGTAWTMPVTKKAYQVLLILCANAQPKARKRAHDAVRSILSRPPPPTVIHPAANLTAEFILRVLHETTKTDQHAAQQILALLQSIVPYWPTNRFNTLCQTLLQLPKFNNIFLTKAAFDVFQALFEAEENDMDEEKFLSLLRAICELKPAAIDDRLLPTWLLIVSKAYPAFAKMNKAQCATDLPALYALIFNDLNQESKCYREIAACLSTLVETCVTDEMIEQANAGQNNGLTDMIGMAESGLGIHYQAAWQHIMVVMQAFFRKLHRSSVPLMNGCLARLGELRLSPAENYKEQLDKTLGAAIATMGPEGFLAILPLNLESPSSSNAVGRAFLLPLLKAYTTNTSLGFFVNYFIPLGDRLAERGQSAAERDLALQAKVYETLVNQIWSLAPGFCDLPYDLCEAFNDQVAERFSSILYTQPDLRPTIAKALQLLIEKNRGLAKSDASDADLKKAYGVSKTEAIANVHHLSKFAVNYLAVFFNVYSQIAPIHRGFLSNVIDAYLSITSPQDINITFQKVLGLLSQSLENPEEVSPDPAAPPPMSHTMLDLATIMVPFLDFQSIEILYNGVVSTLLEKEDQHTLQKKGYKILSHLMDYTVGRQVIMSHIDDVQEKLLVATSSCSLAAKKHRVLTLVQVVRLLPASDLHFIPAILSEAVISTKGNNEAMRNHAFTLLVEMGKKMKEGGIVKNSKLEGFDDSVPDAPASISEFFMMVTAGLAGTTAHMIAATITALARIIFEFKDDVSPELASELLQTMNVFVASNNREIVSTALGYTKVCVVILDASILEPQLPAVVSSMLKCSHQHRSHFKAKLRHIFERLIRRFSYETVASLVPEDDKKLIANIQKRRLQAKRKKAITHEKDEDEDDIIGARETVSKLAVHNDAFEDIVYGSESELEGSDNEEQPTGRAPLGGNDKKKNKKKIVDSKTYIREDEASGPVDFLDPSALGRISSAKPVQRKQRNLEKASGFAHSEDGRMVITESDNEDKNAEEKEAPTEDYYMQAQNSADGFVRDRHNKIKFKKNKNGANDDDIMDLDDGSAVKQVKRKAQQFERIGKEFKAKRAGGDVKRKGKAEPFAYMPLSKVIKKKTHNGARVTFTGKVKK
ncbi:NUC173 domain-containing protein [Phycomyces nitens]|nr:NUC173 domain-containing protein [Phycomyces nitens]